jgi:hypothetical protein
MGYPAPNNIKNKTQRKNNPKIILEHKKNTLELNSRAFFNIFFLKLGLLLKVPNVCVSPIVTATEAPKKYR